MTDIPAGVSVTATQLAETELGRRESKYTIQLGIRDAERNLLGDVSVSKGGVDWRPRYAQDAIRASWSEFVRWMES